MRRILCAAGFAVVGLASIAPAVAGTVAARAATTSDTPPVVPSSGSLFGAFVNPAGGGQGPSSIGALEATMGGRKLDINRVYSPWDQSQPSSQAAWDTANGIVPLISIDPTTAAGVPILWSQIVAGADDAAIVAQARGLASLNAPVLLDFSHEPVLDPLNGTAADFVARRGSTT